jgi:hypothetical protein
MAALLNTASARGAKTADNTIAQLKRAVSATVRQQAQQRPMLACHWLQAANGRLYCQWDLEVPDIPIPPH